VLIFQKSDLLSVEVGLVEQEGVEKAEVECLADGEARKLRKEREATRRAELDHRYVDQFAARVRALFPKCPRGREQEIAEHACRKYSGRVGRSAAAKGLALNGCLRYP